MVSNVTHKRDKRAKYTKTWDVINHIHDYGIDIEKREIFLFPRDEYMGSIGDGEASLEPGVEYGMANQFIKNLRTLMSATDDPILIHMKTCGGYWEEGLAMYQAIRSCPNYVTILNYASARSMSSLIFLAADRRVMMPYSTFMFHRGTNVLAGTGTQVDTQYAESMKADRIMIDIYIEALRKSKKMSGWSEAKIEKWIRAEMKEKEDVFFSAEESLEYNFADMIFGVDGTYDWTTLRDK